MIIFIIFNIILSTSIIIAIILEISISIIPEVFLSTISKIIITSIITNFVISNRITVYNNYLEIKAIIKEFSSF